MKGTVFNIQRFSINDGPGIRTTVFLKGCPLRCVWCHNPESHSSFSEILFDRERCMACGACASVCERHVLQPRRFLRDGCSGCGRCADACAVGALQRCGSQMTADEVMEQVLRDKDFYAFDGGMTLSGGEPLLQADFSLELLALARRNGLHTCIETCGCAEPQVMEKFVRLVDLFLYDYKETDPVRHLAYTGVGRDKMMDNLRMIDTLGAKTVLRCPIIPTYNDRPDHFIGIADTANSLQHVTEIHVEPYHPLGKGKAERLGQPYALDTLGFPDNTEVESWIAQIQNHTDIPVKRS